MALVFFFAVQTPLHPHHTHKAHTSSNQVLRTHPACRRRRADRWSDLLHTPAPRGAGRPRTPSSPAPDHAQRQTTPPPPRESAQKGLSWLPRRASAPAALSPCDRTHHTTTTTTHHHHPRPPPQPPQPPQPSRSRPRRRPHRPRAPPLICGRRGCCSRLWAWRGSPSRSPSGAECCCAPSPGCAPPPPWTTRTRRRSQRWCRRG